MGLDITVVGLDWGELERTPAGERPAVLEEATWPGDEDDHWPAEPEPGWTVPASPRVPWSGRYTFGCTSGSYKPHFWAGRGWEDVRGFADPVLREALDGFLGGLFWHDDPLTPPMDGLVPSPPPGVLVACPPAAVEALAAHWARAEPLLEGLRAPYARHAADPGGWIEDFDRFDALVREWAVVVTGARRRGWGVLGLPF